VWPYPRLARASAETCAHFPPLSELTRRRLDGEKYEFDITSHFSVRVPSETVLERICCLDSGDGSRERRLSPAEAIERLGNGFMYMLWPGDGQRVLDLLCEVAETVPVYAVPRGTWRDIRVPMPHQEGPDHSLVQLLSSGNLTDLRLGLAALEERPELRAAEILQAMAEMPAAGGSTLVDYCRSRFPFFGEPLDESGSLAGKSFVAGEQAHRVELDFLRGVDGWLASGRPDEKRLAVLAGQRALHAEYEGIIGARWGSEALRSFRALRSHAPQVDRQLSFAPTFRCNLACKYCMSAGIAPQEASLETARGVVRWAARAGVRKLGLQGGEPTFYSGFSQFLQLAREAGLKLYMPSNLVASEEVMASVRPDLFERVFAHVRPPATAGETGAVFHRNLLRLRDAGIDVVLRYNLADEDWGFVTDLAREIKSEEIAFSIAVEQDAGTRKSPDQWLADARLAARFCHHLLHEGIRPVLSRPLPLCHIEALGETHVWNVFRGNCGACRDGCAHNVVIWPDATVVLCPSDRSPDGRRLDEFSGWADLQAHVGPRMRAWLDQPLWPECSDCYYRARRLCQGACLLAKGRLAHGGGRAVPPAGNDSKTECRGGTCR
jgi:hypothetical protein